MLGYPNEYGRYTDRPLLDPSDDPEDVLPLAEDVPGKRDFGRNGTYLVLRDLVQDVPAFWQFVDKAAMHNRQGGEMQGPPERHKLAQAMVGRVLPEVSINSGDHPSPITPAGSPITPLSSDPIVGVGPELKDVWLNRFTYRDNNVTGGSFLFDGSFTKDTLADFMIGKAQRLQQASPLDTDQRFCRVG